ncbi:hypothetical protein BVY03_05800, partial [bacterium K02(2017)]
GLIKVINKSGMKILGFKNKKDIKDKFIEHMLFNKGSDGLNTISLNTLLNEDLSNYTERVIIGADEKEIKVNIATSVMFDNTKNIVGTVSVAFAI